MATATARPVTATKRPRTLAGNPQAAEAAARKQTLVLYETAMKLVHAKKYEKAHKAFNDMLASAPPDFAASIRMYINTCVGHVEKGKTSFASHEEKFDYGIFLLNQGNVHDARIHFNEILHAKSDADYAFYGLALLEGMTGNTNECIKHLTEAIRLNANFRFQARSDSDFAMVADDPSFTELLYPEIS